MQVCPIIEVSPRQRCSGLAIALVGGRRLAVTVLPKVWRPASTGSATLHLPSLEVGHSVELTAFEGDRIRLSKADADVALALVGVGESRGTATPAAQFGNVKQDSPLFGLGAGVEADEATTPPVSVTFSHEALLGLVLLAGRVDALTERPRVQSSHRTEDVASAAGFAHDDHPISHLVRAWALVRALAPRIRDARRGYHAVTDRPGSIRGRITAAGMLQHGATGAANLECAYDEFSEVTPLLQVVVTTLELLAAGEAARGLLRNSAIANEVMRSAGVLRCHLAGVPGVGRAAAAQLSGKIRLPPALAGWSGVLGQCRLVLLRAPPGPERGKAAEDGAFAWRVDTAKLWERLLEDSLRATLTSGDRLSCQGGNVRENKEMTCPAPWPMIGDGDKAPDLQLCRRSARWVLDAKYKLPEAAGLKKLSMEDQYQLYAYSLLAHDMQSTHAAVVRPLPANSIGRKGVSSVLRVAPPSVRELSLYDIRLPFPSPEAAADDDCWREALAAMRRAWAEQLSLAEAG